MLIVSLLVAGSNPVVQISRSATRLRPLRNPCRYMEYRHHLCRNGNQETAFPWGLRNRSALQNFQVCSLWEWERFAHSASVPPSDVFVAHEGSLNESKPYSLSVWGDASCWSKVCLQLSCFSSEKLRMFVHTGDLCPVFSSKQLNSSLFSLPSSLSFFFSFLDLQNVITFVCFEVGFMEPNRTIS